MIGIYIFKNIKEKKVYIGQSSRLEERFKEHYYKIRIYKDKFHINLRENPDDFEYSVIEYCNVEELDSKELYWMNWYKNEGWELYNVCLRKMPNNRGKHRSEETRKKISESCKGRETWNKGISWCEESKKKMSKSRKGKYTGENSFMFGKHHSEETRKKISESNKGKQAGENNPMFGKHWRLNPETGKRVWY